VLVNDLIVAGHDIGRTSAQLEADIVTTADERRGGGTWMGGLDHDLEASARPVAFDGSAWTWSADDRHAAGRVTAGAGFIRCVYDRAATPVGPSTADRAARFWGFIARETGADTAGLTPATSGTPRG